MYSQSYLYFVLIFAISFVFPANTSAFRAASSHGDALYERSQVDRRSEREPYQHLSRRTLELIEDDPYFHLSRRALQELASLKARDLPMKSQSKSDKKFGIVRIDWNKPDAMKLENIKQAIEDTKQTARDWSHPPSEWPIVSQDIGRWATNSITNAGIKRFEDDNKLDQKRLDEHIAKMGADKKIPAQKVNEFKAAAKEYVQANAAVNAVLRKLGQSIKDGKHKISKQG